MVLEAGEAAAGEEAVAIEGLEDPGHAAELPLQIRVFIGEGVQNVRRHLLPAQKP